MMPTTSYFRSSSKAISLIALGTTNNTYVRRVAHRSTGTIVASCYSSLSSQTTITLVLRPNHFFHQSSAARQQNGWQGGITTATTRRSLFIQTEATPNPDSIKFLPGREVLTQEQAVDNQGFYATRADSDEIARSPLAKEIFKIDGVKSIYFGTDFITVTKLTTAHWAHLRTFIFSAIMDFYSNNTNAQALLSAPLITDTTILDTDDEVVAMIKELLETRIRPAVQEDGGDIRYVGFEPETGVVR